MFKPNKNKLEALSKVMAQIRKEKGDIVYTLSENPEGSRVEVVPTGLLGFDIASVIGGIPRGRMVEIYGPEAGGKTTLAVTISRAFQRQGGTVLYVDMEHTLERSLPESLGVNPETFVITRPRSGEEAIDLARSFVKASAVDLVVIDSIPSLVFTKEIEADAGDSHMGLLARNLSTSLRVLNSFLEANGVTLILINQLRLKIGGPGSRYNLYKGPETTTTGGMAPKYFASMRIDVRRVQYRGDSNEYTGHRVRIKFEKNKFGPLRSVEMDLIYGKGFDEMGDLLQTASLFGVVRSSGAWLYYGDVKHKGKDAFIKWLEENPDVAEEIRKETLSVARTAMRAPMDLPSPGEEVDEGSPSEVYAEE